MKLLLLAGIIAITYIPQTLATDINKVKIIKAKVQELDDEYVDAQTYELNIVEVNQTYNRLEANYKIKKDIPEGTDFTAEILQSNSKDGGFENLHTYVIQNFCENKSSEYSQYLPGLLITLNNQGKCYPKGVYNRPDATYFRFADLLSQKELEKYSYFKMIQKITLGKRVLYALNFVFESNYKKY